MKVRTEKIGIFLREIDVFVKKRVIGDIVYTRSCETGEKVEKKSMRKKGHQKFLA